MTTKKVKKPSSAQAGPGSEKKRKTVTFDPEPDVLKLLSEAENAGRGVRSTIINQALREIGPSVLANWRQFRKDKP